MTIWQHGFQLQFQKISGCFDKIAAEAALAAYKNKTNSQHDNYQFIELTWRDRCLFTKSQKPEW